MSGYTIGEIAIWLLLAAVVGVALGWTLATLRHRARTVDVPAVPERVTTPATVEPVAAAAAALAEEDERLTPGPYPRSARSLEDGSAPAPEWTVKGNTHSMIFHGPSSRSFARTHAEVWFRTEEDALAAGFAAPGGRTRRTKEKAPDPGGKGGSHKPTATTFEAGDHAESARPGPNGEAPGPEWTIKGNEASMIYHAPDSRSYDQTIAETWFRTEADARAAGFRAPKNG